jgi:hypothetical protein
MRERFKHLKMPHVTDVSRDEVLAHIEAATLPSCPRRAVQGAAHEGSDRGQTGVKPAVRLTLGQLSSRTSPTIAACRHEAPAGPPRVSGYVEATEVRIASKVPGRVDSVWAPRRARPSRRSARRGPRRTRTSRCGVRMPSAIRRLRTSACSRPAAARGHSSGRSASRARVRSARGSRRTRERPSRRGAVRATAAEPRGLTEATRRRRHTTAAR